MEIKWKLIRAFGIFCLLFVGNLFLATIRDYRELPTTLGLVTIAVLIFSMLGIILLMFFKPEEQEKEKRSEDEG